MQKTLSNATPEGSDAEKLTVLLYRFEEEGSIETLQEALLIRESILKVFAGVTGGSERPPNIDFSRFDQFVLSLKNEAEKNWKKIGQGQAWRRLPQEHAPALKQAILEFERQLEMRRLIPRSSNPDFWYAFQVLRDQILRDIVNVETITTVAQRIPNNVVWSGLSPATSSPMPAKAVFASDDPISPVLPDGTPLPESYEDFLKLLERDPSLIRYYRHKFAGYARQARRGADWKRVLLFAREVAKHRPDDVETLLLLARGIEQVGDRADLQAAIPLLERVETLAQTADNQGRMKEARSLRQSVRGKLSIVQRGLPSHHSEVGQNLLARCNNRAALIYYASQARGEQNHVRAAFFSTQLVQRYGGGALDLRYLVSDLEQAGLYGAAEKILERLQKLDPNEVDPILPKRLRNGIPSSYLDVTPEILEKCDERDLVALASQARRAGDFKSTVRFQRRLAELSPQDVATLMRLAGDLYHAGDLAGALEIHTRIVDLVADPEGVRTTHIIIQEIRERLGEKREGQ